MPFRPYSHEDMYTLRRYVRFQRSPSLCDESSWTQMWLNMYK